MSRKIIQWLIKILGLLLLSVLCSLKAFLPQRRKDRKGRQEIHPCLMLLSVLSVLAVKILGFGFAGF